jgi:hypothetical protein
MQPWFWRRHTGTVLIPGASCYCVFTYSSHSCKVSEFGHMQSMFLNSDSDMSESEFGKIRNVCKKNLPNWDCSDSNHGHDYLLVACDQHVIKSWVYDCYLDECSLVPISIQTPYLGLMAAYLYPAWKILALHACLLALLLVRFHLFWADSSGDFCSVLDSISWSHLNVCLQTDLWRLSGCEF